MCRYCIYRRFKRCKITKVIIDGNLVAKDGVLTTSIAKYDYPEDAMHSMHIKNKITPASFNIMAENKEK